MIRFERGGLCGALLAAWVAIHGAPLQAQNIKASVSGVVMDAQGGAISGARIVIRDKNRDLEWETASGDSGRFHQPALDPGSYTLEATAEGFRTYRTHPFELRVGEAPELTIRLEVGEISTAIEVTAALPALQTDDVKRGRTFDQPEMNDLPNPGNGFSGRNFYVQALTTPGVTYSELAHRPFAVNGQRPRNNNYMIDSVQVNDPNSGFIAGRGRTEQVVSQEAVGGMEILTHNFKAEYGRNSGSVVSLVSRAGSNDVHGSAYWYHINSALGARNFFSTDKVKSRNNLAGFTVGGPIKKNRVFFFGNFETNKERGDDVSTFQTLTPEERARANPAVKPLVDLYPVSPTGSRIFAEGRPRAVGSIHLHVSRGLRAHRQADADVPQQLHRQQEQPREPGGLCRAPRRDQAAHAKFYAASHLRRDADRRQRAPRGVHALWAVRRLH